MTERSSQASMQLDGQLEDLNASPTVRRLVRDVSKRRSVLTDRRGNYLSVRPLMVGAIAVYAHTNKISIAVEPSKAEALHLAGKSLRTPTSSTTYVVLESADVQSAYPEVLDLAIEALDWRATGPAVTLGHDRGAHPNREVEICPECWTEITPAGTCICLE